MALIHWIYYQLLVLVLVYPLPITAGDLISYNELQKLNVSCPKYDSCSDAVEPSADTLQKRSCECGEHCAKYKTCCVDSPSRDLQNDRRHKPVRCQEMRGTEARYYMVATCDPKWSGDVNIKSQCEKGSLSLKDPVTQTPGTNSRSGVVYKNYFCAMCNDDLEDLTLWNIRIIKFGPRYTTSDPTAAEDELLEELSYDEKYDKWGFYGEYYSHPYRDAVFIGFEEPPGLENLTRFCLPDMVSDCAVNWTDGNVLKKCEAYMAAIYAAPREKLGSYKRRNLYRNIHCAICNNAVADGAICWQGVPYRPASAPPVSFTLLLDVNQEDGKYVGRKSRCKEGESYDQFFKKCRNLVCALPGYTMVDGKCIQA